MRSIKQMGRWARFLIVITIGFGIGLYYAWVLNPVEVVDTTPDTLRIDYKTDYVLMISEVYQQDGDLFHAARSLGLLGDEAPLELVQAALDNGMEIGYAASDLERLKTLRDGFQTWNPNPDEGLTP